MKRFTPKEIEDRLDSEYQKGISYKVICKSNRLNPNVYTCIYKPK